MPRRHRGMYRTARQVEQSLVDAVRAVFPDGPIDLDMPLAQACPTIFAPSPADRLALIDASFKALAARCRKPESLAELKADAERLRQAVRNEA